MIYFFFLTTITTIAPPITTAAITTIIQTILLPPSLESSSNSLLVVLSVRSSDFGNIAQTDKVLLADQLLYELFNPIRVHSGFLPCLLGILFYSLLFALTATPIIREMKPVIEPKMPRPGASAAKPINAKKNAIAIIIIAMAKPDILLSSF